MKKTNINLYSSKDESQIPVDPKEVRALLFISGLFLLFLAAIQIFSYRVVCMFTTICVMPIAGIVFGIHQLIKAAHTSDHDKRNQAILFGCVLILTTIILLSVIILAAIYA